MKAKFWIQNAPAVLLGVVFGAWALSSSAWAFPENVRHGYPHCVSCHVNPNGGGLLNDYGRNLSKAIQSYGKFFFEFSKPPETSTPAPNGNQGATATAGSGTPTEAPDPETQFLYGYVAHPTWLNLGGDVRFLQLFSSTPTVNSANFYVMQLDLEAAVTVGRITVDGTVGRIDPTQYGVQNPSFGDYWYSRRHYILVQATDEFFLMGGRYQKPYGIVDPNHSTTVREFLGWNYGTESYNLQAGYLGSNFDLTVYGDLGRPDTTYQQIEQGGGATMNVNFSNSYKVGLSYFYGSTTQQKRHVFGPWAILGFTSSLYLKSENDFVVAEPENGANWSPGFATYNRAAYEWVQGFQTYLEQGFNQLSWQQPNSSIQMYGVGLLYYPRPHWEFEANFQERNYAAANQGFTQYAYLQLHYYL